MSRLLVVDDDAALRQTLSASFRAAQFEVLVAHTGELGVYIADHERLDGAVIDLGLPKLDGIEVVRRIRLKSTIPIIVLSARHQEATKVEALNAGADDYVTKPFGIDELIARINANLRRGIRSDGQLIVETETFTIDLGSKRAVRSGIDIHLTATEWRVLSVLIARENEIVSHAELLQGAWGNGFEASVEYLRVYIGALRRKLEISPATPKHIITEPSSGYRFVR